jgi:hypothetical protein
VALSPQEILQRNTRATTLRDLVLVVIEVIIAIHEKALRLPEPGPKTRKSCVRHTPSFTRGIPTADSTPYTALQIATFLDRTQNMGPRRPRKADRDVRAVLNFLELVEEDRIDQGNVAVMISTLNRENALDLTQALQRIAKKS